MNTLCFRLLHAVWWLFSLLPMWMLYALSSFLYIIIYKLAGYRVKVVRSNLRTSFPEKSDDELRAVERQFYHGLCDFFVETVKMMSISERKIRRHFVFKGIDALNECLSQGQSCALYIGHFFNWEWITSLPLWLVQGAQSAQLYHALENPAFDRLFITLRQRWGSVSIPLVDILRKTVEYKRAGTATVVGYLGDQVPYWNNIHHWCQFLNHDTPVMTGTERIAKKNKQAMFYLDMRRIRRGYYEAEFKLMTRHPEELGEYEATDLYYRMLEENIKRQPELWLWTHKRWKRTREEFNRRFQIVDGKVLPRENAGK